MIALRQKREVLRVYAVITPSVRVALGQVDALATEGRQAELVGGLSRDVVRPLGLKPGEVRPI